MNSYSYWNREFESLVPLLCDVCEPLPIFEATVTATGIDPDLLTLGWRA